MRYNQNIGSQIKNKEQLSMTISHGFSSVGHGPPQYPKTNSIIGGQSVTLGQTSSGVRPQKIT